MEAFNNVVLSIKDFFVGTYYAVSADWYTCAVNNQNKKSFRERPLQVSNFP